jgi:hypothetical protein
MQLGTRRARSRAVIETPQSYGFQIARPGAPSPEPHEGDHTNTSNILIHLRITGLIGGNGIEPDAVRREFQCRNCSENLVGIGAGSRAGDPSRTSVASEAQGCGRLGTVGKGDRGLRKKRQILIRETCRGKEKRLTLYTKPVLIDPGG